MSFDKALGRLVKAMIQADYSREDSVDVQRDDLKQLIKDHERVNNYLESNRIKPTETPPHKYEIDRRYPFEATAYSVCPVLEGATVCVWRRDKIRTTETHTQNFCWKDDGRASITHFMVTEYPPEKHTAWVNVYDDVIGLSYETREMADEAYCYDRTACIKIEWTEGEGL